MKKTIHIKLITLATLCACGILHGQNLRELAVALKQIEESISKSKSTTIEPQKQKPEELERIEKEEQEQIEKERIEQEKKQKALEEQLKKEEKQQAPKTEQYKKIIENLDPKYLEAKGEDATAQKYSQYDNPSNLDIETQDNFIAMQWNWNTLNNNQKIFLAKQFGSTQEQREEAKIIEKHQSNPEKLKEKLQKFNEDKLKKHAQKLLEEAQEKQPEKSFEEILGKTSGKIISLEMKQLLEELSPTKEATGEGKKKTFTTKDPSEAPWINISEQSGDTVKKQFLAEYWKWDTLDDHQKIFLADNIKPLSEDDWLTPSQRTEVKKIKEKKLEQEFDDKIARLEQIELLAKKEEQERIEKLKALDLMKKLEEQAGASEEEFLNFLKTEKLPSSLYFRAATPFNPYRKSGAIPVKSVNNYDQLFQAAPYPKLINTLKNVFTVNKEQNIKLETIKSVLKKATEKISPPKKNITIVVRLLTYPLNDFLSNKQEAAKIVTALEKAYKERSLFQSEISYEKVIDIILEQYFTWLGIQDLYVKPGFFSSTFAIQDEIKLFIGAKLSTKKVVKNFEAIKKYFENLAKKK